MTSHKEPLIKSLCPEGRKVFRRSFALLSNPDPLEDKGRKKNERDSEKIRLNGQNGLNQRFLKRKKRALTLFLGFFVISLPLLAFEVYPVTSFPVVGYQEISFTDPAQQENRNLLVWYPVDPKTQGIESSSIWDVFHVALNAPIVNPQAKKPIILISHGYGGNPHQLSWLTQQLVSHQYIVLGIRHQDRVNHLSQINFWKRPQDLQTLLNIFSKQAIAQSSDLKRVGIAGFSLGGATAIWLTGGRAAKLETLVPGPTYAYPEEFNQLDLALPFLDRKKMSQNWRDERIKAAFIMAPAWAWIFDEKSLQQITIPTYLIAPIADNVLVTSTNAGFFARNIPRSLYQTITGEANHYVFITAPDATQRQKANLSSQLDFLFVDPPTVNRKWIQSEVASEAVRFFDSIFYKDS